MEYEVKTKWADGSAYSKAWNAFYKNGTCASPTVVYGTDEHEAKANALAYYRKNTTMLDMLPMNLIVDKVVPIA